jgi:predicted O-methyltransferase YrrM
MGSSLASSGVQAMAGVEAHALMGAGRARRVHSDRRMTIPSTLRSEPARSVIDRLHEEAKGDRKRFLALAPRILLGILREGSFSKGVTPGVMKECFIPLDRESGELMYLTARAIGAKTIVEFGTSFGNSTLYLAAAVRDGGGGLVIGTEIEASKHARALGHLEEAGLRDLVDVRLGDALQTLRDLPDPVDLVLLDGWKDLYLPVLDLVQPRLRKGAVVVADNIFTFRKALRPYVEQMQSGRRGFDSTTLSIGQGMEYSVGGPEGGLRTPRRARSRRRAGTA